MKRNFSPVLLALLGMALIVVFWDSPMMMIFPLWICVHLFRHPLARFFGRFSAETGFLLAGLLFGLLTESFAVASNLSLPPAERILLHPEPLTDLFFGVFFYGTFILAWMLLLHRIDFSVRGVFLLSGVYGIFAEETGQVFLRIFTQPVTGVIYALLVACVYGIFPMLAYRVTRERFSSERIVPKSRHFFAAALTLFLQYAIYGNFIHPVLLKFFS